VIVSFVDIAYWWNCWPSGITV